jgi:hypothetical protein
VSHPPKPLCLPPPNPLQLVLALNSNAYAGDLPPRLDPLPPPPPPSLLMTPAAAAAAAAAAQGVAAAAAARHARQYALNVHPEAAAAAARGAAKAPGLELEADGARGAWVAPNAMLLGLKTGQLVLVTLRFDGASGAATKITVRPPRGGRGRGSARPPRGRGGRWPRGTPQAAAPLRQGGPQH